MVSFFSVSILPVGILPVGILPVGILPVGILPVGILLGQLFVFWSASLLGQFFSGRLILVSFLPVGF
jgi:hypothetical protein